MQLLYEAIEALQKQDILNESAQENYSYKGFDIEARYDVDIFRGVLGSLDITVKCNGKEVKTFNSYKEAKDWIDQNYDSKEVKRLLGVSDEIQNYIDMINERGGL